MTTQTAFAFDTAVRRPQARATDPETSREAARSIKSVTECQEFIYEILSSYGPQTDEEIFEAVNFNVSQAGWIVVSPSGARTRRSELVDMNLVRDSGKRRKTRSGRNAIVWEAV